MRKLLSLLCACVLLCCCTFSAFALDYSGMFSGLGDMMEAAESDDVSGMFRGLGGLLGSLAEDETGPAAGNDETPSLPKEFTGKLVKVKVGKKTLRVHQDLIDLATSYEAFYDSYVAFLSSDTPDMAEYTEMMGRYAEIAEEMELLDRMELSDADALYWADAQLRISEKLLTAAK